MGNVNFSDSSDLVLNTIATDFIESGVKPNQFEIVNSLEDNIFVIALHFNLL